MKQIIFPIIFFVLFVLIDFYAYRGFRQLTSKWTPRARWWVKILFWTPSVLMVILFVSMMVSFAVGTGRPPEWFMMIMSWIFVLAISKMIFMIFHFGNDVIHFIRMIWFKLREDPTEERNRISRIQFLNQVGLGVSAAIFTSFIYGMVKGKYDFTIRREFLKFPHFPSKKTIKIVQLSDAHLGTFGPSGVDEVSVVVDMINNENPDFIFFTGDLVNNIADEAEPFVDVFSKLNARIGKYSILGNHDYAEYYYRGDSAEMLEKKRVNMLQLESVHRRMGFQLLRNEKISVPTESGIPYYIIGLENWGRHFFQFGDLVKASYGIPAEAFQILLSHDPTHFEEEVMGKGNIALTLSGHTHGAQFGVEAPELDIKWSPSPWFGYKRWGGLYQEGKNYLYVNRGLGCLGFPGRVGIAPEITVIEIAHA
ncbi:MAG: metallophosphoesterase [Bacteroidetes bacterium]|nr:metallophosphoesterase [Bacteroidota bacterium]